MPKVKKIDHIALVVEEMDAALAFWQDALGITLDHTQNVPQEESIVGFLPVGDPENGSEIELVQPTTTDSGIAKYLKKRGAGMHHICLEVDDIDGFIERLKNKGVQLIHNQAVVTESGKKYAFIHPKAAFGVLVELYELPA